MHILGLFIKANSYVTHVFYAWSFSHNTIIPIDIKRKEYFISLNTNTTVFSWIDGSSNKNIM